MFPSINKKNLKHNIKTFTKLLNKLKIIVSNNNENNPAKHFDELDITLNNKKFKNKLNFSLENSPLHVKNFSNYSEIS